MVAPHLHFQDARTWTVRADFPVPDGVGSSLRALGRIGDTWQAESGRGESRVMGVSW
jgi:hypothetical protein